MRVDARSPGTEAAGETKPAYSDARQRSDWMTFTDHGDSVTLQMNRDQFLYLSWLLEIASTAMGQTGCDDMVYGALKFVNELNRTNPNFTRYELPPEPTKAQHE
jgi:hypothetical protein